MNVLTDPSAPPADQLRTRLSVLALHGGPALLTGLALGEDERHTVAQDVTLAAAGQD